LISILGHKCIAYDPYKAGGFLQWTGGCILTEHNALPVVVFPGVARFPARDRTPAKVWLLYAFPSFPLILPTLHWVNLSTQRALLVVLEWPLRVWFPLLLCLLDRERSSFQ
ncbi:hypothetical protein XENOCAPTIV_016910, partial [Xenoophorus captivus]